MSALLPWVFVALAAVTLMAGLYALWASFRAAFGAAEMPDMQGTVEAASGTDADGDPIGIAHLCVSEAA